MNQLNDNQSPAFTITYIGRKTLKSPQLENFDISLYNNSSRDTLICNLPVEIGQNKNTITYSGCALIVPDFPLS